MCAELELFKKLSRFVMRREFEVIVQIGIYEPITVALNIDIKLRYCILALDLT